MTSVSEILSSDWVHRLGWTLLHSLWQITVVAMALLLVFVVLRRRSAQLRYVIGCLGLLVMFALPVATYWIVPGRPSAEGAAVSMPPAVAPNTRVPGQIRMDRLDATGVPPVPIDEAHGHDARGARHADPDGSPGAGGPEASISYGSQSFGSAIRLWERVSRAILPWMPWFVVAWLVGVFSLSVWHLGGWMAMQRLKHLGTTPGSRPWAQRLAALVQRMNVSRPVRMLQSAVVEVPAVIGWLRPVVLVPAAMLAEMSPRQIEVILAHELAHIRRYDYLMNLLQTVIETLLFYHPAVWWLSRRIRIEREHCCDDAAVTVCGSKLEYAEALKAVEQARAAPRLAVAATGADNAGTALGRVRRVLGLSTRDSLWSRSWLGGSVAVLLLAAMLVSCIAWAREMERAKTFESAEVTMGFTADGQEVPKRTMVIKKPRQLRELQAFFPKLGGGRKSSIKGGWEGSVAIQFTRVDGSAVRVTSDYTYWSEGAGDWRLKKDLGKFINKLFAPGVEAEVRLLEAKIREIESWCVPAKGTLRHAIEKRFGKGMPSESAEAPRKRGDPGSTYWLYEFCENGSLLICYDSESLAEVVSARYLDPQATEDRAKPPAPEEQLRAPEPRLKQMQLILAEYKKRFGEDYRNAWGEAVEGVQVRLRADKTAWIPGEDPTFQVDIRNRGKRERFIAYPQSCKIEVDGQWHTANFDASGEPRSVGFGGRLTYSLSLGDFLSSQTGDRPVNLRKGKHTVRVALSNVGEIEERPGYKNGVIAFGSRKFEAISNPVEIEIVPTVSGPEDNPLGLDDKMLIKLFHVGKTLRAAANECLAFHIKYKRPPRDAGELFEDYQQFRQGMIADPFASEEGVLRLKTRRDGSDQWMQVWSVGPDGDWDGGKPIDSADPALDGDLGAEMRLGRWDFNWLADDTITLHLEGKRLAHYLAAKGPRLPGRELQDNDLKWGPETDGLRMAARLSPAKAAYALGEKIELEFHVRNVSDHMITIAGFSWRQDAAPDAFVIENESGERLKVGHSWYSGDTPIQRDALKPGETAVFKSSALAFLAEGIKRPGHPVGHTVMTAPGRHTLQFNLRFPDGGSSGPDGMPRPTDWQGVLATAPVTIYVGEPPKFALFRVLGHRGALPFGGKEKGPRRKILFSGVSDEGDGSRRFDSMRPEYYPLEGLILDTTPLLTEADLAGYDWPKHEIHLKPGVRQRLLRGIKPSVWGVPFAVVADGEPVYLGAFWTGASSYMANMPTISLDPWQWSLPKTEPNHLPENAIRIENNQVLKPDEKPRDPRANPRLRQALSRAGKLIDRRAGPERDQPGENETPAESATGGEETPWGPAVEGVQCRLRADKTTWRHGTVPSFAADVRNRGARDLAIAQAQQLCELEVDGNWYQWAGVVRVKSSTFPPFRQYDGIRVTLLSSWHSKKANRPLEVTIGKHTVRVAFMPDPMEKDGKPVRAVSNPVEIEIVAKSDEPAKEAEWGEAVEGVQCRLEADKPTWKAVETPTLKAHVRHQTETRLSLSNHPTFGARLEVDGHWHRWDGPLKWAGASHSSSKFRTKDARPLKITLDEDWKRVDNKEPLRLDPGRHVVRFAWEGHPERVPREGPDEQRDLVLISSPVEIEIVPDEPAPEIAFSPVIEQVLRSGPEAASAFIDLDSHRLIAPPVELDLSDVRKVDRWARQSGVDAQLAIAERGRGLRFFETFAGYMTGDSAKAEWNSITADSLRQGIADARWGMMRFGAKDTPPREGRSREGLNQIYTVEADDLPMSIKFQTREGGIGILQILGFTDEPKGVKIRYKLVQRGKPAAVRIAQQRLEAAKGDPGVLLRQLNAGELSDEKIRQITGQVLAIQGDLKQPWDGAWGNWLETARVMGKVSDADFTRYAKQSNPIWQMEFNYALNHHTGRFGLSFRDKHVGGRVASATTDHNLIIKHRVVRLSLGELSFDLGDGGKWSFVAKTGHGGGFFRVPEEIDGLEKLRPGKHEAVLVLEAEIYETGRPDKTLHHCRIELKDEVELPELLFLDLRNRPSWGGKAVDGVQVRLRARKRSWRFREIPTLKADIRNRGERKLSVHVGQELCELEVDGRWCRWAGASRTGASPAHLGEFQDIDVALTHEWHYKKDDRPLELTPGKHWLRLAFSANAEDGGKPVRAVSNEVEIVIRPDESTVGTAFGPVVERIVNFNFMEDAAHLDLDSGKHGRNQPGKDLIAAAGESDMRVRSGLDMVAIPVDASRWNASPDEILAEVAKAGPQRHVRLGGPESRRTFFFKTREGGGVGVLRIVPIGDGQGNVKVRYKKITRRLRAWGPAVEVQVRLRADEKTWKTGTLPSFKADVRNQGTRDLYIFQTQALCELEVDGNWYQWAGPGGEDVKSSPLSPGRQHDGIPVTLVSSWHSKKANRPLEVTIGKHIVRVAFIAHPTEKDGKPVRAVSNPVEIEILPDRPAPEPTGALRDQESIVTVLRKLGSSGADLTRDDQGRVTRVWLSPTKATGIELALLPGLPKLQWLVIERLAKANPPEELKMAEAELVHLQKLVNLRRLSLPIELTTDATLVHLKGMEKLEHLSLNHSKITDAGLAHLKGLTGLKSLTVRGTEITDAGLAHLKGLANLESLDLQKTPIGDVGLMHLKGLGKLGFVDLSGTQVTPRGMKRLMQWLPNVRLFTGKDVFDPDSVAGD